MLISADENIPGLDTAFAPLGRIRTLSGRAMRREDLRDTEILLVRSVTRVDPGLLEGTPVRFVGSATIGVDHVDLDYLHRRGIAFANAPGCNAAAAAQYVLACVLRWCAERGRDLAGLRVGIVGCGQVGSRVLRLLQACGAECRVNDPPRARREGEAGFVELDALDDCDLITLHVPLSRDGPDPTWHLFDRARLARLKPGMLLINAARGAVIDNPALLERLGESALEAVLDTWEGEPAIDSGLLAACYLGTPHIAGYSLDGRLRGTEMVYRALCRFLGREPRWSASRALPPPAGPIPLPGATAPQEGLRQAVLGCYDPAADCARLRSAAESATGDLGARFDQLRREYPPRREFTACRLLPAVDSPAELCRWLHDFGFLLPDS